MTRRPVTRLQPTKYRCSHCLELGHNSRTCPGLPPGERRKRDTYAAYGLGERDLHKNPFAWEKLTAAREAVRIQLEQALGRLSPAAPAVSHISNAIKLLENVR
jgi:hypothetical protein